MRARGAEVARGVAAGAGDKAGEWGVVDKELAVLLESVDLTGAGGGRFAPTAGGDGRHWILSLTAPRVAAGQTLEAQPKAMHTAVRPDGVEAILRTGRREAAPGGRTAQPVQRWGNDNLVHPQQADEKRLHGPAIDEGGME